MGEPSLKSFQRGVVPLSAELQESWQFLAELSDELSRSSLSLRETSKFQGTSFRIHAWYQEASWQLLAYPVDQFLNFQPIERALDALQACDREVDARSKRARARIDDSFQRLLVRASLDLCEPWRIWRGGNHQQEWKAWEQRRVKQATEARRLLEKYRRWESHSASTQKRGETAGANGFGKWRRQQLATTATLQMETAFRHLTLAWLSATERLSNEICGECQRAQSNAAATLSWLEDSAPKPNEIPAPVSVEERLRTWASPIEDEATQRLPEQVEILLSGAKLSWRSIPAQTSFLRTFRTYGRAPMRANIEQSWAVIAKKVREVWQAKEVVAYWGASPESSGETELMREAKQNAIAILREQVQPDHELERFDERMVEAFWLWNEMGSLAFEAEQFGWARLLLRPRGRAVIDTAAQHGQSRAKSSVQHFGQWTSGKIDRALEFVSGKVPEQPTLEPVIRRTTLRDTLSLPAAKTTLPGLYRLLFRLTPVEDKRFLMGRDQELAGLRQAAEDWDSGRYAACLMIGARGSGKTSLLNCAVEDIFAGRKAIRAEFHERILNPETMNAFLRRLLDVETDGNIEAAFREGQRIVILEESERIFLRKVGGFAAAHYLMHLIHRTAPSTLWIVVMNDKAFRVLDAATELHRVFSHRINAMNVSRSDLEKAILERHHLSGLRLKFIPPPAGDPRVNRVKQWLNLEDSAQKLFFDSLFQQSEGIFRSAFELWLSSVERKEGETLTIRQPLDPAFGRFRGELAQEDQFTLLAIQEHGSLTRDELTEVLCEPRDVSGSRMERLAGLGLIEPDPVHPGVRVRPEAQRFVNDLLRRTNLT